MTQEDDDFELLRGSGNIYSDLGIKNSEQRQLRAILAAEIGKTLAARKLTVRGAEKITSVAAADFSRIRNAKLSGFTIDRLMIILDRLDREVKVSVSFQSRRQGVEGALALGHG